MAMFGKKDCKMQTNYSIVEAKNKFTSLIRSLHQQTEAVTVTKRGKPVAIIVSVEMYEQLQNHQSPPDFREAYQAFREEFADDLSPDDVDVWADVRDKSAGREENVWQ
jgi:prevent-host-death family protein